MKYRVLDEHGCLCLPTRPARLAWGEPTEWGPQEVLEQFAKDWAVFNGDEFVDWFLQTMTSGLPAWHSTSLDLRSRAINYRSAYRFIDRLLPERDPLEAALLFVERLPSATWE